MIGKLGISKTALKNATGCPEFNLETLLLPLLLSFPQSSWPSSRSQNIQKVNRYTSLS